LNTGDSSDARFLKIMFPVYEKRCTDR